MPVTNIEIAKNFRLVADLLEIRGANEFRVRAYRNAAQVISGYSKNLADMIEDEDEIEEISGIGEDLAEKIVEIVSTGELGQLDDLTEETPEEMAEMLRVSSLGPKRVQQLNEKLNITTLDGLLAAAQDGRVRELDGFGEKIEQEIIDDLEDFQPGEGRVPIDEALQTAEPLIEYLRECPDIQKAEIAGSYRRRKETVGDLDIATSSREPTEVIDWFTDYENISEVIEEGDTRSIVLLSSGMQVDLRVVEEKNYGAALFYFTGSKQHNIELRNLAVEEDLKLNEYGLFDGDELIAGETEGGIYDYFNIDYIAPELREKRGEIEAAKSGELPDLITLDDLKGDLQIHTVDSDGHAKIPEIVDAAKKQGYEYIAITDHARYIGIVQGLDADGFRKQMDEIDRLNEESDNFTILKSVEVDILEDGSLTLENDILSEFDIVLGAVHSAMTLDRDQQTERIIKALDKPHFNILGHPTGRKIEERLPIELNMEKVMEATKERNCVLEINASPHRLDLKDSHIKMGKDIGVNMVISTDAHRLSHLEFQKFGVWQARRGWLTAGDVINTMKVDELLETIKR